MLALVLLALLMKHRGAKRSAQKYNSRYCALLYIVACTLGMGNRAAGDAQRSVQAT